MGKGKGTWRQQELSHYGDAFRWLALPEAEDTYREARKYDCQERWGLDPATVDGIEHYDARGKEEAATEWLQQRFGKAASVLVVFGDVDVALVPAAVLVAEWPNIFMPSRDDAIVLADDRSWVAFYQHEDRWEWGRPFEM